MIKYLLFFLIIPILSFGQQQIGQTINYIEPEDGTARTISISSDGKIVAIGSPYHDANGVKNAGTVRVFRYLGGNWTQIGQSISGMFTDGNFGFALTMSADGKTFATKNHDKFTPNAPIIIKIYRNTLGNWTLIGNIVSPNNSLSFTGASDRSISLSADGNTIAFSDGKLPGNLSRHDRVRVFQNISGVWTQIGQDINSKLTSNAVGIRNLVIHPNGNIVALTEEDEISNNNYASKEYVSVYHLNTSGSWSQLGQDFFTPKDPSRSHSGEPGETSLSLASTEENIILAIGSPRAYNNSNVKPSFGIVHIHKYEHLANTWTQVGQNITDPYPFGIFRVHVSLSANGKRIAISDGNAVLNGQLNDGFVQVYENNSNTWSQIGSTIQGIGNERVNFNAIALSGDGNNIAVGFIDSMLFVPTKHYVRVYDLTKPASTNQFVLDNFNVFPNPATDVLNITLDNELILEKIMMYNNLGKIVKETKDITIDVSNLAKGIYFVEVHTNQGKAVKKVILK